MNWLLLYCLDNCWPPIKVQTEMYSSSATQWAFYCVNTEKLKYASIIHNSNNSKHTEYLAEFSYWTLWVVLWLLSFMCSERLSLSTQPAVPIWPLWSRFPQIFRKWLTVNSMILAYIKTLCMSVGKLILVIAEHKMNALLYWRPPRVSKKTSVVYLLEM